MTAGSAWVRELSLAESPEDPTVGARRASIWLTAGFVLGPTVAGLLAEVAPAPLVLAYLPHLPVGVAALIALRHTPETRLPAASTARPLFSDPRRFSWLVVPSAGWVFGAMAIAFIVTPTLLAPALSGGTVAFATLLTLCALATGFATQLLTRRLASRSHHPQRDAVRTTIGALGIVAAGTVLAAVAVQTRMPALAPPAAAVLGVAFGLLMVTGLAQSQAAASPAAVGTVTAIFYSLAYLGFSLPTLVNLTLEWTSPTAAFTAIIAVVALCAGIVAIGATVSARGLRGAPADRTARPAARVGQRS